MIVCFMKGNKTQNAPHKILHSIMIAEILKNIILYILHFFYQENFTIQFKDYSDKIIGYCKPDLSTTKFRTGNYSTCCWNKMSIEDCNLLNKNGIYCGKNLNNGKPILCKHIYNKKCKNDSMCFSSCYPQTELCNQRYMIDVKSDKIISNDKN